MLTEKQADELLELVEATRHAARQEHRGTAEAGRKTDESWQAVLNYIQKLRTVKRRKPAPDTSEGPWEVYALAWMGSW